MDVLQALLLGIIEGVTEFLPVSSTGHLLVAQRALGLENAGAANTFAICIQAGAIVAVLGLYRARVLQMLRGLVGKDAVGRRLALALLVAFLPAAVLGAAFDAKIERALFGPWPVVAAWAVGGFAIIAFTRWRRGRSPSEGRALESLDLGPAFLIGLAQCLALWPGTSRSLATIIAGSLLGLSMPAAVEFSFLLGVLTLGAATVYKAIGHGGEMLAAYGWVAILVGFAAAALSALVSVKWMLGWLSRRSMMLFAWWRIGLAAVVASALLAGWM